MVAIDSAIEATLVALFHRGPEAFPKVAQISSSLYSGDVASSPSACLSGHPVLLWIEPQLLIFK